MSSKNKIDTGAEVMGPYSLGISVKDHIWLSGQIDNTQDGIEAQTRGTLAKIDGLLEAAGSSSAPVTFTLMWQEGKRRRT